MQRTSSPADGVPPLLGLHSLFFDRTQFDALSALLGEELTSLDYADEPWETDADPARALSDDVRSAVLAIERRGGGPVDLVGASMGAYVAMRVAAERPDVVGGLVLMGCTARDEQDPAIRERFVSTLAGPAGPAKARAIGELMFGETSLRRGGAVVSGWLARFAVLGPIAAVPARRVFARASLRDAWRGLTCPTLLIAGAKDRAKPLPHMQEMKADRPDAELVVLEDCGHSPAVEDPHRVAADIRRWRARRAMRTDARAPMH